MKSKILYLLSALFLISCGGGRNKIAETAIPEEETDFFVFDLEGGIAEGPKAQTINELIENISYIPLETHKDALLGDPYSFAKIGGDLFIRGGMPHERHPIYQFDSLGRFVKQVTYHGRGPNEISFVWNWHANAKLKQINVVDMGKMLIIQTENGEKSNVEIRSYQGWDRVPLNDSTFVSGRSSTSSYEPHKYLFFVDGNGNLIHSIERSDELSKYNHSTATEGQTWPPYEDYNLWPDYNGDAIFQDIFNDTLYRIKSRTEITPHLVFKRGALSPRPEDTHKLENKKKQIYFGHVMETRDHIFLKYYHGDKRWCDVWSKRDGSLKIHATPEKPVPTFYALVPFELPDGSVIDLQITYADRDNVYGVLGALDACKFLPGVKEDDNPVIVVMKLK